MHSSSREKESGEGEVTSWHLSLSTSSTYLIPSTLPSSLFPNLLSGLFISPSPHYLLISPAIFFFFLISVVVTKHYSPSSFICILLIPCFPFLPLSFCPSSTLILQLQSVSMSLGVNRSSIKANLNFIHSVTGEFIKKRGGRDCLFLSKSLSLSFTVYSRLGLLPFSFLCCSGV